MTNRPIVCYAASFILGSFTCTILLSVSWIFSALFLAAFLIIMFYTTDIKYFVIIICFYTLGFVLYKSYYDYSPPKNVKIRITQKSNYGYKGIINGKIVYVSGKMECKEGELLNAYGSFKRKCEYQKGIIGTFKIQRYSKRKDDLIAHMYLFRKDIYEAYKESFGEKDASIIVSLCFGDTSALSGIDKDNFKKVGVIHAISVSGFHIAAIYKILELLADYKLAIVISFFYVIFTGGQSSTVRAFIMILVLKLSKKLYKNYDKYSALAFSALIISVIKPYSFLEAGFVLSFLSTLGIMIYYNKFIRFLYRLPVNINEAVSITLSSQVFAAPYSIMIFNSFGSGFLIGNILLLPIYTVIVVLGNISLVFYKIKFIFKFVSYITALFTDISLYVLNVILLIVPDLSEVKYYEGLMLLVILTCYILYNKGYTRVKHIPLITLIFILVSQYNFFPLIDYVNINNKENVIVRYKKRSILIANYDKSKDVYTLKDDYEVTDVITNIDKDNYHLSLGAGAEINVTDDNNQDKYHINMAIKTKCNKYYLTSENYKMCISNNGYHFVNVPNEKECSYIIIFGRLYKIK